MRLLHLYDLDLPADLAAPVQILRTCRALAERGVEVVTAWKSVADPAAVLRSIGEEPHPGLQLRPGVGGRAVRRLAESADVVMSRGEPGVLAFAQLRGARPFVYETHRPVVNAARPLAFLRGPSLAERERAAVRGAAGLVAVSEGALSEMRRRHGGNQPARVLPSGTDPPPADADPPRDLGVIYAGKLEARKGVGVLLEAMALLPGVRLSVLGGDEAELAALRPAVRRAEAAGARVDLVGRVPAASVRGWFRRARCGVCPLPIGLGAVSERFTSPMKIVEMMACGTPIVASDLPSVREILTDGVNARLVAPSDPQALAEAIRDTLAQAAVDRVQRARDDARAYAWPVRAERLHSLLEEVLGRSRRGP